MPLCHDGELVSLWKGGGLIGVQGRPLEITMHFSSLYDFWQPFLLRQGPAGVYVQQLSATDQGKLREEVEHRLAPHARDGAFELRGRVWAVRGTNPH